MQTIILTNTAHDTTAKFSVFDGHLSATNARQAAESLCGMSDCECQSIDRIAHTEDGHPVELTEQPDGSYAVESTLRIIVPTTAELDGADDPIGSAPLWLIPASVSESRIVEIEIAVYQPHDHAIELGEVPRYVVGRKLARTIERARADCQIARIAHLAECWIDGIVAPGHYMWALESLREDVEHADAYWQATNWLWGLSWRKLCRDARLDPATVKIGEVIEHYEREAEAEGIAVLGLDVRIRELALQYVVDPDGVRADLNLGGDA